MCGQLAKQALERLVRGRDVTCRGDKRDRYKRLIAVCYVGNQDINAKMVRQGWALAYRRYSMDYVDDEKAAKVARRSIWGGEAESLCRRGSGEETIKEGIVRSISVILISLFLAACQATTGQYLSEQQRRGMPPCKPIPIHEASVNWAVFGTVVEVENCPGRGPFQEIYVLTNGWGIYQQANSDTQYFEEINERAFRESLASKNIFADSATTIKIHIPPIGNRYAMFAQKRTSGKNYIYFSLNSSPGHGDGTDWGKALGGLVNEDGNMSPEEFRQHFLERLRVFDTPAAASFIASQEAKKK